MFKFALSWFIVFIFFLPLASSSAKADVPSFADISYTYSGVDPKAIEGDILITTNEGLVLANATYSNRIFGVLQNDSVMIYKDVNNTGTPVARAGIAQVNVTTINGPIKKGDFITSSPLAGKGMKAVQSGYVLGTALDDFSGEGAQTVNIDNRTASLGSIKVALRIEYAEIDTTRSLNRLLEYFNSALFRNIQDPEKFVQIVRYAAAGFIIILSFAISFFTFSRTVAKGVEGIGRNPLAKNAIQFSMFVSAALTVAIVLIGIIASFVIIRF